MSPQLVYFRCFGLGSYLANELTLGFVCKLLKEEYVVHVILKFVVFFFDSNLKKKKLATS